MLRLRCARQTRAAFLSPPFNTATTTSEILISSTTVHLCHFFSSSLLSSSDNNLITSPGGSQYDDEIPKNDIVRCFREWFMSRKKKNPVCDRIFEVLRTHDGDDSSALSRFDLRLSETLILDVLNYGKEDILSCLKFFDWAAQQPGFYHTRATFNAVFRILSKAKLMSLMLEILGNYGRRRKPAAAYQFRHYNVLVIGYAVAGKPETALQLFGKMRFCGVDLDGFAYHVLLNSLVEKGYFDMVETVAAEIRLRGFENEITHTIRIKCFCNQNKLEEAAEYLQRLARDDGEQLSGIAVGTFVDALCKDDQFERAALLIEDFQRMNLVSMEFSYGVWIRELLKTGKVKCALEFFKDKQAVEGYTPDVVSYNMFICKLLKGNRIEEAYDMLVDMKEREILPDNVTMNAVLCFLCKAGMLDIAMDLYDSRVEFGFSGNCMVYSYLLNALLRNVGVDEAYRMFRNSIEHGYIPEGKNFAIMADALAREGRLDKLKEMILLMLDQNITLNDFTYKKFISAFCRAGRVEEAYVLHGLLYRLNKASRKITYTNLISGFSKSRADIAARLLIEMQEAGYRPSRKMIIDVIHSLCRTDNPESKLFRFLEMQLSHFHGSTPVLDLFIDGAGRAGKPQLAMQVYDAMRRRGIEPVLRMNTSLLLLQSYLKGGEIHQPLHLFGDLIIRGRKNRKLWHVMIVGLCKAGKSEFASMILHDMKANKLRPSIECYEELIKLYCDLGKYYKAMYLVNDMTELGRPLSSFIGNVFLLHALKTRKVYNAWAYLSQKQNITPVCWMLGHVIGVFSGSVEGYHNVEELEKLIQQCFYMDIYTNNMLLRRLGKHGIDYACRYFGRLCQRGFEPNRWTYDIIIHGLVKDGRNEDAKIWMEQMLRRDFGLTESTRKKFA